ncbi:hypothetical protein A0128_18065 [Leptospira tipperaryensis]|uniref:Uncharacterized protein n=1 Tax=Leptospira tipperaryensis TaxID=2564040 RepID=A0A1D7V172_9LEPT|nr:hypothetical protein [Leptospira tipperaryensis]AOP35579.1 hypothetical protein A0128_18065 [Leptospira tipperaryensis]
MSVAETIKAISNVFQKSVFYHRTWFESDKNVKLSSISKVLKRTEMDSKILSINLYRKDF